jgi:hypothetical protein
MLEDLQLEDIIFKALFSYHRPIKDLSNSENALESLMMSFTLTSSSSNSTSLAKLKHDPR